MGEIVLKNAKIYVGGHDLSGSINSVSISHSVDMLDKTTFGSSARKRIAGLKSVEFNAGGWFNASSSKQSDPVLWPEIGAAAEVVSIVPQGESTGNRAFFTKEVASEYSPGGSIGEIMRFDFAGAGDSPLIRGSVIRVSAAATTGTGIAVDGGTRKSTQRVYGVVHCKSMSSVGATLDVVVQSACSSGFPAATAEATFTSLSTVVAAIPNAEWKVGTASSTIRNWLRVNITSTSTTPAGDLIVNAGFY